MPLVIPSPFAGLVIPRARPVVAPPPELSFRTSATSTAETIEGPGTIEAGDLLVLWDWALGLEVPSAVVPDGFDIAFDDTFGTVRQIISYGVADGSEASADLTGMPGKVSVAKVLLVFAGGIASASAGTWNAELTNGDPSAQTVTVASITKPLVIIASYSSSGAVNPRSFSPAKDGEVNNAHWVAYKIYNSEPENTSVDMDDEGNNNWLTSGHIEVS